MRKQLLDTRVLTHFSFVSCVLECHGHSHSISARSHNPPRKQGCHCLFIARSRKHESSLFLEVKATGATSLAKPAVTLPDQFIASKRVILSSLAKHSLTLQESEAIPSGTFGIKNTVYLGHNFLWFLHFIIGRNSHCAPCAQKNTLASLKNQGRKPILWTDERFAWDTDSEVTALKPAAEYCQSSCSLM